MTGEQVQAILNDAEKLHAQGVAVDQGQVGVVIEGGAERRVSTEVWLAMRAILIGRGFAAQAQAR